MGRQIIQIQDLEEKDPHRPIFELAEPPPPTPSETRCGTHLVFDHAKAHYRGVGTNGLK